jgi:hypothetical protein
MVFILSLQDLQGDNKVVNLIEDWDVLEEYALGKKWVSTSFSPTTKKSS